MAQANQVFQRVEKKYLLTEVQYQGLLQRMRPYMMQDEYGLHTICNIYYDTQNNDLISRSIEKPVYKEKIRLRSYGVPRQENKVFLEIKKKYKGIVYKRRESMTLKEAKDYLENGIHPQKDSQIMREIDYFLRLYRPKPKLYLAYDRIAFYGITDPDFRMTFDTNIRSREDNLFLEAGSEGKVLLPKDVHLLELKIHGAVPLWLSHTLSELSIFSVSFSKYGSIYKENHEAIKMVPKMKTTEDEECLQVLLKQGV